MIHWMTLTTSGPDVDELRCPECGRRVRVQWEPQFAVTVLEAGDKFAVHAAARPDPADDTRREADLEAGLREMGFGKLCQSLGDNCGR